MNPKVGKAITDAVVNLLDAVKEVVKDQGYQYFQVNGNDTKAGIGTTDIGVGAQPSGTIPPGPKVIQNKETNTLGSAKGTNP